MKSINDFELYVLIAVVSLTLGMVIGNTVTLSKLVKSVNELQAEEPELLLDTLTLNEENFIRVCKYYDVQFPDVVFAQAKLESGHFSSKVFRNNNNMLGLYDSINKRFYHFDHWTQCLRGYKELVQYKYEGIDDVEAYYAWLAELPYASDEQYVNKVKSLMK